MSGFPNTKKGIGDLQVLRLSDSDNVKLDKDGITVMIPQPSDDPDDPVRLTLLLNMFMKSIAGYVVAQLVIEQEASGPAFHHLRFLTHGLQRHLWQPAIPCPSCLFRYKCHDVAISHWLPPTTSSWWFFSCPSHPTLWPTTGARLIAIACGIVHCSSSYLTRLWLLHSILNFARPR